MPYQPNELLSSHFKNQGIDLSKLDEQLKLVAPDSPNLPLYRDMMLTVLRMAHDDSNRWNAKITLQALRELDHAFRTLEQYKGRRKVTVFGSARTPVEHPMYALARELGATLARSNLMVITGAGGGIMAAAHEGAGVDHSLGFNITLPFEQHANPTVDGTDKLLPFHFFFIRKLFFVKEADALVLCPGGFGTLDEALEVLTLIQTGKSPIVPIILLDRPNGHYWETWRRFVVNDLLDQKLISPSDLNLFKVTHDIDAAMAEILQFYRNFHSYRWVQDRMVIRVNQRLTDAAMEQLNKDFDALLVSDKITQTSALPEEVDDAHLAHFYRIVLIPHRRDFGTIRLLIDAINNADTESERAPLADVATTQHM